MPRTTTMQVVFANPRSGVDYGFSELRVENLIDTTHQGSHPCAGVPERA